MGWALKVLLYGWVAASGGPDAPMTNTVYSTNAPMARVLQRDIIEPVVGIYERNLALGIETNYYSWWGSNTYVREGMNEGQEYWTAVYITNRMTNAIGWRTDWPMMAWVDGEIDRCLWSGRYVYSRFTNDPMVPLIHWTRPLIFTNAQIGDWQEQESHDWWTVTDGHYSYYWAHRLTAVALQERYKAIYCLQQTEFTNVVYDGAYHYRGHGRGTSWWDAVKAASEDWQSYPGTGEIDDALRWQCKGILWDNCYSNEFFAESVTNPTRYAESWLTPLGPTKYYFYVPCPLDPVITVTTLLAEASCLVTALYTNFYEYSNDFSGVYTLLYDEPDMFFINTSKLATISYQSHWGWWLSMATNYQLFRSMSLDHDDPSGLYFPLGGETNDAWGLYEVEYFPATYEEQSIYFPCDGHFSGGMGNPAPSNPVPREVEIVSGPEDSGTGWWVRYDGTYWIEWRGDGGPLVWEYDEALPWPRFDGEGGWKITPEDALFVETTGVYGTNYNALVVFDWDSAEWSTGWIWTTNVWEDMDNTNRFYECWVRKAWWSNSVETTTSIAHKVTYWACPQAADTGLHNSFTNMGMEWRTNYFAERWAEDRMGVVSDELARDWVNDATNWAVFRGVCSNWNWDWTDDDCLDPEVCPEPEIPNQPYSAGWLISTNLKPTFSAIIDWDFKYCTNSWWGTNAWEPR